jgi:hypothetical protein
MMISLLILLDGDGLGAASPGAEIVVPGSAFLWCVLSFIGLKSIAE